MKKLLLLLSIIALGCIAPLKGQAENMIEYQVSYENAKISIDTLRGDNGKKYSYIEMGNLRNSTTAPLPGNPCFPGPQILEFSVPFPATDFKLKVKVEDEEEIILPYPPYPAQPDHFAGEYGTIHNSYDDFEDLIKSNDYKEPQVAALDVDFIFGMGNRIVRVDINPVRWALDPKTIKVAKKIDLQLSWTLDESLLDSLYIPKNKLIIVDMIQSVKRFVVNPEDVVRNSAYTLRGMQLAVNKSISVSENIPYIIITPKNLVADMERLAALRRLRGIATQVVSVEDILTDPESFVGDFASGILDEAGMVRGFLSNSKTGNQTKHVLLASKFPEVTGRWVKSTPLAPKDTTLIEYVSDQYFRDLTTPWPKAVSDTPGDLSKLLKMQQDMNVGRISFLNKSHIDSYIDKLIQYEFNVHNSDLSYLDNAFIMLGEDSSIAQQYKDLSKKIYNKHFNSVTMDSIALKRLHTGAEVMAKMKNSNYGFLDLRGHGHYSGIRVY